MNDLAKVEHHEAPAVTSESAALISMIERAARDPNVDINKMERLFEMHERVRASNAKTSYLAAFAQMQANLPAAVRKGTGHNDKAYARYEDLIGVLKPMFAEHGFSISHRISMIEGKVIVTGVLGHRDGHSEETSIPLPVDTSGNKNAVQAMGSSISYGKRYVTLTLTGIATEGEDDDAKKAVAFEPISEAQQAELTKLIHETKTDINAFLRFGGVESLADIAVANFPAAKTRLQAKKAQMMKAGQS